MPHFTTPVQPSPNVNIPSASSFTYHYSYNLNLVIGLVPILAILNVQCVFDNFTTSQFWKHLDALRLTEVFTLFSSPQTLEFYLFHIFTTNI